MILSFILTCCFIFNNINGQKLHEHMTKDEIQAVFNVNHDSVHEVEYEVVPIFHNNNDLQRKKRQIEVRAFNSQYTLSLERNDNVLLGSNAKVYVPTFINGVLSYNKRPYPTVNLQIYHDVNNRAALTLYTDDNNKVHVQGTIGDNIILRPLPSRVRREILSKYPNTYVAHEPSSGFSSNQTLYHVAMKQNQHFSLVAEITNPQYNQSLQMEINGLNRHLTAVNYMMDNNPIDYVKKRSIAANLDSINVKITLLNSGHKQAELIKAAISGLITRTRKLLFDITNPGGHNVPHTESPGVNVPSAGSPDIVYPEILLVIDHYTYVLHGRDINKVATYMAAHWNAVDLRFRELNNPKVRLNIAGLVITPQPGIHGFLENYSHIQCDRGTAQDYTQSSAMDYIETLTATSKHFHSLENEFPRETYDIIAVMTNRRISKLNQGACEYAVGVAAATGGACGYQNNLDVTIITDHGGFDSILTAAHELGHLLGAPHDWPNEMTDPQLKSWAQKGGQCDRSLGYLMSYVIDKTTHFHWSPCSKLSIQRFLESYNARCLYTEPNVGSPYKKILPGKLFDRNHQCQRRMKLNAYAGSNPTYLYSCTSLYCETTTIDDYNKIHHHETYAHTQPAEGTSCGNYKICLNGECVSDRSSYA